MNFSLAITSARNASTSGWRSPMGWYDLISFPAHLEAIEKGDVAKIYLRSKPKLVADQGGLFTLGL